MIGQMTRTQKYLCALGVFLFLYSIAGVIVGHYFLSYYDQQLTENANLDLDQQPCPYLCGYSFTRQKPKNYCCDFYGSSCRYKADCQLQRGAEYATQLTIYKVVFGISIAYMSLYIIYQACKQIVVRLWPCLMNYFRGNQTSNGSNAGFSGVTQNTDYNNLKDDWEVSTQAANGQQEVGKTNERKTICPICLECSQEQTQKLKCGHSFHKQCIISWTSLKETCPLCRRRVASSDSFF